MPAARSAAFERREEALRVAHLYRNGLLTLTANSLAPLVVVVMLWPGGKHKFLIAWLLGSFALFFMRLLLFRAYRHARADRLRRPQWWGWWFTLGSFLSGILWGLLPLFAMDAASSTNVLVIMLVVYGLIAGSISSNSVFYPAYVAFVLPAGLTLSAVLAEEGEAFHFLAGLLVLFLLVNLGFAWNHRKIVSDAIRQRLINRQLLLDVERKHRLAVKANRDKSRFLAAVSHDLRQPLHALDLFHGSLATRLTHEDQRHLLEMARQSSASLGEMLGELIDMARFDADKVVVSKQLVPLDALVEACARELRPLAEGKGLSLRVCTGQGGFVETDPVLLKRVLRNLLVNAVNHTENGGVLIGIRRSGRKVSIQVCDTGEGIPDGVLPHIFDAFYQAGNPERNREKGLGLGLSIVRHIADLLEYELSVSSRVGRGSCFKVIMPVVRLPSALPLEEGAEPDSVDLSGRFFMVVDDDAHILKGIGTLLNAWGCEVLLAESDEALRARLVEQSCPKPDALICDYRLRDGHTGLDVVTEVRHHFKAPQLPAVIVSGDLSDSIQDQVREAGCLWLEKPVRASVLKATLASLPAGQVQ